jgi:signal transduction histidine kinase
VSLQASPSDLRLVVRDSGTAFEPNEALKKRGLGLVGMKKRLKLVERELTIDTRLLGGTTVRARVPLNSRSNFAEAL